MATESTAQDTTDAGKADDAATADKAADKGTPDPKSTADGTADDTTKVDAKTEDGAGDDKTKGKDGDTPKAPESYTLKVPDEAKRFASDKVLERIQTIARANDWTNEEAQAALNEHLETVTTDLQARVGALLAETKADPVWGGANFPQTQKLADKAIDHVMPEGHPMRDRFLRDLKDAGGDVSLPFVAFLAILGSQVSEDTAGRSRSSSPQPETRTGKFYDHPSSIAMEEQAAKAG